jgi:hypothetical protein
LLREHPAAQRLPAVTDRTVTQASGIGQSGLLARLQFLAPAARLDTGIQNSEARIKTLPSFFAMPVVSGIDFKKCRPSACPIKPFTDLQTAIFWLLNSASGFCFRILDSRFLVLE